MVPSLREMVTKKDNDNSQLDYIFIVIILFYWLSAIIMALFLA
jgi:hypothetical protein